MGYITPAEFRKRFPMFGQAQMQDDTAWDDTVLEGIIRRVTGSIRTGYSNFFPNDYTDWDATAPTQIKELCSLRVMIEIEGMMLVAADAPSGETNVFKEMKSKKDRLDFALKKGITIFCPDGTALAKGVAAKSDPDGDFNWWGTAWA